MRFTFIVVYFLLLTACNYTNQVSDNLEQEPYFDLPSLVDQQLLYLDSLRPTVEVTAFVNDNEEVETMQKDSTAWSETLELFSEANINRPVLQGSYQVSDSIDEESGWDIRIYQAHQPEDVEIPYLAVYYQDSLPNVREIEIVFHEENILYHTERRMKMRLKATEAGPLLTEYQSWGTQKMLLQDSVRYSLKASVQYDQPG